MQQRWEARSVTMPISDPATAAFFGFGNQSYAGITVGETSALGLSAVYRAVSLISQSIAQLPLRTLRDVEGTRTRVNSFLDNPGGPDGPTAFEWNETVLAHLLLHGNAFLAHVFNQGGGLVALVPIHPGNVSIIQMPEVAGGKVFRVSLNDGTQRTFDSTTMTHIPGLSLDGIRGMSLISVAANSLGTAVAGDRAAARMFRNGALISGLVTPEEDLSEEDAKAIRDNLNRNVAGWDNAGDIAVINRKLKFQGWSISAEDAQFLQSRQFSVEEISRWFGVPTHLLSQTTLSTWGSGIAEQNRGLSRTVLAPWCARIEQRLSRLLTPAAKFVEFDMAGLERGSPAEEIDLLIKQVQAGLLTPNEARHIRNLPPLPDGDAARVGDAFTAEPEAVPV